jgi:hypothetical protein
MWKQRTLAAVAVLGLAACGLPWEESGSGTKVTQVRELSGFNQVHNTTRLEVNVLVGEEEHVEVTVDDNLQDFVEVEIVEDALWVRTTAPLRYSGEGRVDVVLPRLVGASLSGSGTLVVEGRQQAEDVTVSHSSSGRMSLCTDVRTLEASHSGSGDLSLCVPEGGEPLGQLTLHARGSGETRWRGGVETAQVEHLGSGRMVLSGAGAQLTLTQEGSGDVDAAEFTVRTATLTSSSSGDVVARVSEEATVRLSGSGNIEVRGGGQVDIVSDTGSGLVLSH